MNVLPHYKQQAELLLAGGDSALVDWSHVANELCMSTKLPDLLAALNAGIPSPLQHAIKEAAYEAARRLDDV